MTQAKRDIARVLHKRYGAAWAKLPRNTRVALLSRMLVLAMLDAPAGGTETLEGIWLPLIKTVLELADVDDLSQVFSRGNRQAN